MPEGQSNFGAAKPYPCDKRVLITDRSHQRSGYRAQVKEPECKTISRHPDEPKLEIGDSVPIKEGVVGVILARFTTSGERRNEVH
jgi:hypothetical protein